MKKSLGAKTIAIPTPVWVVGTYDNAGKANVMTVAWGGICCSKPPCVTISLRKATHTYGSLMMRQAYTVNIPSAAQAKEADFYGMATGRKTDKFAASGLTAVKSELVDAPFIREFPMVLECKVIHTYEIGLHTQFIGEIVDVKADEDFLGEQGLPDVGKIQPIAYSPADGSYYSVGGSVGKAYSLGKQFKE
jgi:flavin reductase (DIM6/NTAB) family NADH-FMN oxidoreductase RutF